MSNGERLQIGGSAIDVRLHYVVPKGWLGTSESTLSVNNRNVFTSELTTDWLRVPDQCHAD